MIDPKKVGMSSKRLERISSVIEKHLGDVKVAGAVTLIARRGETVHLECFGLMDRENEKPMQTDTIFRIYSMTKPIVSVALMMLYEQAKFQLYDPVSKHIPAFGGLKVLDGGDPVDLERPVMIRDLLTHTSGLTYHFLEYGRVEEMYRENDVFADVPLPEYVSNILKLPLAFQPGTRWRYSVAVDVVGSLVEILSGRPLDVFLKDNLFDPLGMVDTGYYVPEGKLDRFASMYGAAHIGRSTLGQSFRKAEEGGNELLEGPEDSLESRHHETFRGGHGLVSTAADYHRFCRMMLTGGELDGVRLLSRKTVELITTNQLPPDLLPMEVDGEPMPGDGFGLGFRVLMDLGQCRRTGSAGDYGWGGAANTSFFIDPEEELIGVLMAQFQPGGFHLIADDFRVMAYQAIAD